jgi:hypothetical protein
MVVLMVLVVAEKVKKYAKFCQETLCSQKSPFAMNRLQKGFSPRWVL